MNYTRGFILSVSSAAGLLIFVVLIVHNRGVFGENDASRWATVYALTQGNGYVIDDAPYHTSDKIFKDGHFYSSKPALLPTIVAGIMYVLIAVTGLTLPESSNVLFLVALLFINIIPFMIWLCAYGDWLLATAYSDFTKAFCLGSAACGTYLTAYSITLNNHCVAAIGTGLSLVCFLKCQTEGIPHRRWFFWCGVWSAWAAANEIHAGLLCFYLFGWLWRIDRAKACLHFVAGCICVMTLFFATTFLATHSLIPLYLQPDLYHYSGSYWNHPIGIDSIHEPSLVYLLNNLVGHHGILSLSPIFIFAGMTGFPRTGLRPIIIGAFILTLINCIFVIKTTRNYGGQCQGPRWFFWLIPFWLFTMPGAIDRYSSHAGMRWILLLTLIWSVYSVSYAMLGHTTGPWSTSWLQELMHNWKMIDY